MFLFGPSSDHAFGAAGQKRVRKTLAALYRMLQDDFDRRRPAGCSCRVPMIVEAERGSADEPNWRVEALWCGSIACQDALAECLSHFAKLYDLTVSPESPPLSEATAAF